MNDTTFAAWPSSGNEKMTEQIDEADNASKVHTAATEHLFVAPFAVREGPAATPQTTNYCYNNK
jgi:hypothetical protein